MTSSADDVKFLKPHQLGWLRRPELEKIRRPDVEIWERPDGQLYPHDATHGPLMLMLKSRP